MIICLGSFLWFIRYIVFKTLSASLNLFLPIKNLGDSYRKAVVIVEATDIVIAAIAGIFQFLLDDNQK